MPESTPLKPDLESKSQRKEDMLSLQKIGESLIKLSTEQLAKMDLPDNLLTAIQHFKSLTAKEAKRRQLQYIGKIMRTVDPEPIKKILKSSEFIHNKKTAQYHQVEEWRTNLLAQGDDALSSFLMDHPEADRQQLRQMMRKAQKDRKNNKNTGAETALFKYLRSIIEKKGV